MSETEWKFEEIINNYKHHSLMALLMWVTLVPREFLKNKGVPKIKTL